MDFAKIGVIEIPLPLTAKPPIVGEGLGEGGRLSENRGRKSLMTLLFGLRPTLTPSLSLKGRGGRVRRTYPKRINATRSATGAGHTPRATVTSAANSTAAPIAIPRLAGAGWLSPSAAGAGSRIYICTSTPR